MPRALWLLVLLAGHASAQRLVPGPGEPGHDAALAAKIDGYERQVHALLTVPLGYGLEAYVTPPANRALIAAFLASGATDFEAQTGRHPYEVLDDYGEEGDLGMFGGVQAAGDAFRYGALRDSGAPVAEVAQARAQLVRALDGLHWTMQVTGAPGVLARGIRRITPEPGDPPLPGAPPLVVPLFDAQGRPQPSDKDPTWRADRSGQLPFLAWLDDCSKDQLDGHVFAIGAAYDVAAGDPTIPAEKLDRLVADARALGARLMQRVEVAPGAFADLVIVDADGRPTSFHDLSAEELAPGVVSSLPTNGFNALMGLGAVRTLFHMTGDEALGAWYYDELVGARNYFGAIEQTVSLMYLANQTNFSNVNMAFVAAYGVLRYESDERIARRMRAALEAHLYAPGKDRDAKGSGQSLFDFIYAGFRTEGAAGPGATAVAEGLATLREAKPAPTWDLEVQNCDAAELAANSCTGVDGTPIALASTAGSALSTEPLPMRLRPPSNFWWRSDPHQVNGGGGGERLNPSAELATAYWLGRFLQAQGGSDPRRNVSPRARPRPSVTTTLPPLPPGPKGCGCGEAWGGAPLALWLSALALLRGRRLSPEARGGGEGRRAA